MSEWLDRARGYHQAIYQLLMNDWDPIGVNGVPEAQGEYDRYVSGVYSRLIHHVPRQELHEYLWGVETEDMGLRGDRGRIARVVDALLRIRAQMEGPV